MMTSKKILDDLRKDTIMQIMIDEIKKIFIVNAYTGPF